MVRIFIDPGHGGSDPGAVANGLYEKNLTLDIALRLRDILLGEYTGVEVRMSRETDTTVSLEQRVQMANSWGANYFLSIHINAGGGTGFESYIYTDALPASVTYQNIIHPEVVAATGFYDRGKKRANFYVLRETAMPALLTENGFIDNANDAAKLKDPNFRQLIARGHANGLAKALGLRRKAAPPAAPTAAPKVTTAAGQKLVEVQKCTIVFGDRKLEGIIYEDRSYAPVRALAEALGLQVAWDAKNKTVILKEGDAK